MVALVLNSCLDNAMDWESIEEMVAQETAAGNPIAAWFVGLISLRARSLRLRTFSSSTARAMRRRRKRRTTTVTLILRAPRVRDAEKNDGAEVRRRQRWT